eukprot:SAG31_NODE_2008_length_6673_cov_3.990265_5_plen_149_part_00
MGDYSMQQAYANGCRPMEWMKPVNGKIPEDWYTWVNDFAALGTKVIGIENRERFEYFNLKHQWLKAEAELKLNKTRKRSYFLVFVQLYEKYGTLIERNAALIEKVSPCRCYAREGFAHCAGLRAHAGGNGAARWHACPTSNSAKYCTC